MISILGLALALVAVVGDKRPPDRIELANGEKIEGYVLVETTDEIVVLVKSKERRIPSAQVASIRTAARSLAECLDRHEKLAPGDSAGQVELARYCQAEALAGEADVIALAALCDDPANADAHALLEHVQRQAGWMAKRDNKFVLFEKLLPARKDLREPWKLRTSHYALFTNLALREATCMSIDLERFYRAFFLLVGESVELREVVDPLGVGVYGDQRTFPEGLAGRQAYFDPASGQVILNAAAVEPRYGLIHEATHQIVHATASGTRAGLGLIPGWLDEGLAEYMALSRTGDLGRAHFDLGAIADHHFATHRSAEKPYDLARVLQFASADFHIASTGNLKYAESYTLVHFFLHGAGGKYRAKFFAFLRSAYAGSSSTTDFKKIFDVPEKALEEEWKAHVRLPVK